MFCVTVLMDAKNIRDHVGTFECLKNAAPVNFFDAVHIIQSYSCDVSYHILRDA